ncbi:arylesterase [Patescibacteria group bacterium]|nr:arylesterase [Patescibacteria group bacterium]
MTKTIQIIVGIVVIAIAIYFLFKNKNTVITNFPPVQGPIVALGDSLVFGYGSTMGNDFVSLLAKDTGREIINMGINGNTTADGLARIDTVLALKPSIVLVLLGGNDFLRKVPATQTFQNLDSIVEKLQAHGVVVVVLGIQGGVLHDPFKESFEELVTRRGTGYVPNVLAGMIGNQSLMYDAIHPNDVGYKKLADKVLPVLQMVMK